MRKSIRQLSGTAPFRSGDWDSGRSRKRAGASAMRLTIGRSAGSGVIPKPAVPSGSYGRWSWSEPLDFLQR